MRTGGLSFLNQQASGGRGPWYLSIEESGNYALVANHGSGSVAILPLAEDGFAARRATWCSTVPHRSEAAERSARAFHPPDPTNCFALACDLASTR